ncbi:hypothetical protein SAMN04515672_3669 [Natronorubrum texcoconense]|uniref:Uncharacterized protein n=1 Tax=Natronorubrum texcoconense TaxID=1095776 RepID=A0A1G9DXL6_9EURY|nr:hypothetical protein SAMN04515672_3669 [Natronorubrum texcoconense]
MSSSTPDNLRICPYSEVQGSKTAQFDVRIASIRCSPAPFSLPWRTNLDRDPECIDRLVRDGEREARSFLETIWRVAVATNVRSRSYAPGRRLHRPNSRAFADVHVGSRVPIEEQCYERSVVTPFVSPPKHAEKMSLRRRVYQCMY